MKQQNRTISLLILTLLYLLPCLATGARAEEGGVKRLVASLGADGIQRVEVIGGEYYFEPNHIVVQVNRPVELLLRKVDGFIPHNIVVQAPEAGIDFNVGMTEEPRPVRFTPTRTGKYTMFCDKRFLWFKDHQNKGMEGIIEVVE
jgi:plastocyanin